MKIRENSGHFYTDVRRNNGGSYHLGYLQRCVFVCGDGAEIFLRGSVRLTQVGEDSKRKFRFEPDNSPRMEKVEVDPALAAQLSTLGILAERPVRYAQDNAERGQRKGDIIRDPHWEPRSTATRDTMTNLVYNCVPGVKEAAKAAILHAKSADVGAEIGASVDRDVAGPAIVNASEDLYSEVA